nr:glycoside hydrolase family 78 protein [Lachnospiraceae bacterium]
TKEQIRIKYDGNPLKSCQIYPVKIKVTDNYGEIAEAETYFETGKLSDKWLGEFITDGDFHFTEKKTSPVPMTFKKRIKCAKKIKKARIYSTALGIYFMTLNGKRVGEDYFTPGLTSYRHTLQYETYDITEMLSADNELLSIVGGGWAVGAFTFGWKNRITAPRQAFKAEIHIEYEDGSKEIIPTDESWEVSEEGRYRYGDFYNGEIYDARINYEKIEWKKASFEKVKIKPELIADYGSAVRAHEILKPVKSFKARSGMTIYDFGQNFAGVINARINGKAGQEIVFKHTEILMDSELYTEPLRDAKAEARYICVDGNQEYSPMLTYMGFRYLGVSGIAEKDIELEAFVLYSDIKSTGSFKCSDERINRLQQNIRYSAKSNFMDIPTDCPQRDERMGWTGDIALFAPTACYNFEVNRFLRKWLKDVKSEQRPGGGINVVIPEQGFNYPPAVVAFWGDCCILVPWAMYMAYGDKDILREMYPVMKKYLGAIKFWAGFACLGRTNRHTWRWFHQYGDWVAPNVKMWACMNRGLWTATADWSNSCSIVSQIAEILGENEDAAYYKDLKSEIDRAYRKRFLCDDGHMKQQIHPFSRHGLGKKGEFQTGYVLPLAFNMLDAEMKEKVLDQLVRMVKEADYHIQTGFPGTPFILFALADNGKADEAYKMLMNDSCPSWLYEVKAGGTTIWERWDALREDGTCNTGNDDGTNGMTSFNHYASGSVGNFFYKRIAGIEPIKAGYKKFLIKPLPGGGLTYAEGKLESPYGLIQSEWHIENGKFRINISVPVGTECELILPSGMKKTFGSGNYELCEVYENV